MNPAAHLALIATLAGCAVVAEKAAPEATTITLTPEQTQLCNEQGGCALFTRRGAALLQQQAFDAGSKTCRKETTL